MFASKYLEGDKMLNVALYIRVSTDEQALRGDSIETQIKELNKFARANNYNIVDEYIDEGFSATSLNRPNLQRLLDDVKHNKINLILFTKIDRWSRGVKNYYKLQDVLDTYNVHWKTIFEKYDTTTAAGQLHVNIMLSVAQNEASVTSERIKAVFKTKILNGQVISGSVPYGYKIKDKHLVIDENTKDIVIDIFQHYKKTLSLNETIRYVNINIRKMGMETLKKLLRNKIYIGVYDLNGYYNDHYCEPIISNELFYKVQDMLSLNTVPVVKNDRVALFGKLMYCKQCGGKMYSNSWVRKRANGNKYIEHIYQCNKYRLRQCKNGYKISQSKIEKYILNNIYKLMKNQKYEYEQYITKSAITDNSAKIKKLKKRLTKLKDLYLDDMITKADYKIEYENITKNLSELSSKQKITPDIKNILYDIDISNFKKTYNSFTDIEKRRLWCEIIDKIIVDTKDAPIKVYFK